MPPAEVDAKRLRSFGLLVGGVLIGVFGLALPLWRAHPLPLWAFIAGGPLVLGALVAPELLRWPYKIWSRVGGVLGWVNTRIILSLVFFLLFTPFALVMRVFGRDALRLKRSGATTSYRVPSRQDPAKQIEEPF